MPWTRKLSFGEYAKDVLSSSSVRPVSQVFSSSSHFSKAFNIFIFAISISGCLYQLIIFLSMYFENPTIVEAYLTTPSNMLLPAVTLCNINGISRTDYCKLHPCHVIPKKKLCKRYPVYCLLSFNNDLDDKVPYSNITEIFNYSEEDLKPYRNNFLSDVSEQVAQLLDTDRRTIDVFKFEVGASVRSLLRNPPVCYTVNLMRNQTKRRHEIIPTTYSLFFPKIYLYAEDIIYGPEYAAIQASVHSPYSYTNPFISGFELKIGKFYTFRVKQVEKNLLPWPYKTNCFNYLEKIKQNGKPGPINQKECVENCKVNLSLKMLGCVLRSIWYPHNYRRCEPRNERDLLSYYHKNCSQICQPACSELTYEVTKDEQYSDGEYKCLTDFKALMISSVATALQVTFEPAAKTVYTVIPKYQTLEVISSIGDIIGLWIGLSLIAFFNFIEQIMRIILYPCQVTSVTRRTKVIRVQGIAMHNA